MEIKISMGELFDKITILDIKRKFLKDEKKLANVQKEYEYLVSKLNWSIVSSVKYDVFYNELYNINRELWDIEDGKRQCEKDQNFGEHFIKLARQVYIKNDLRASIKKNINIFYKSEFVEEKSYDNI
jgi:hypothetical protein